MNTIRNLLIILITVFSMNTYAEAGGHSGGGGDVIPSKLKVEDMDNIVKSARFLALISLNKFEIYRWSYDNYVDGVATRKYQTIPEEIYKTIYESSENIQTKLKNIGVYLNLSTPCMDSDGQAKSASIYSPVPNTICVSFPLLQEKTDQYNVLPYLTGLLAHEYSHLVGIDGELEANLIQRHVQNHVYSYYRGVDNDDVSSFLSYWSSQMYHLRPDRLFSGAENADSCTLAQAAVYTLNKGIINKKISSDYNADVTDFFQMLDTYYIAGKTALLYIQNCKPESRTKEQIKLIDSLFSRFKNKNELTWCEILTDDEASQLRCLNHLAGMKIAKADLSMQIDDAALLNGISQIKKYYDERIESLRQSITKMQDQSVVH